MLKKSICAVGVLVIIGLAGCATGEKVKSIAKSDSIEQSEFSGKLSNGFEGSWAVKISCDRRRGMSANIEYGLLEVSKKGSSKYEADFYIFESQSRSWGKPSSFFQGSMLKMNGKLFNSGTEISFSGEEWLLKSNRKTPIGFQASLQEGGLIMKGMVTGDASCPDFVASKFPVNDEVEKSPVFTMGDPGFFGRILNNNQLTTDPQECIDLFKWVGNGKPIKLTENSVLSSTVTVNSLFFDEDDFIRHLGKTYRNWTHEDAQAYRGFTTRCIRTRHQWNIREAQNIYRKYSRVAMGFLDTGKDQPNDRGMLNTHGQRKWNKQSSNIKWASNYFFLGAVKSARLYEQHTLSRLQNFDASKNSIREIKNYVENVDFPLNFLPPGDKENFNETVIALYEKRENSNAEQLLLAFNPAQYPKTLQGLKALLNDTGSLRRVIHDLDDQNKRDDLNRRYDKMLGDHSLAAGQEITANIPSVNLTPKGYVELVQYVRKTRDEDIDNLHKRHQMEVNEKLNDAVGSYFTQFYSEMDQWVASNIPNDEGGIDQLNKLSKLFFNSDFYKPEINVQLTGARKQIANKIITEVDIRQNNCDQLAAHPQDKKNPYHILGVFDELLNIDAALGACIDSVEQDLDNPRLNFQLGRVLFVSQLYDEAHSYLEQAANNDYDPANYYLGMMQLEGYAGFTKDIDRALVWFEKSANAGFLPAINFVQNYRKNLADLKREEERIANAQYKDPKMINMLLTGKFDKPYAYSIGMLYVSNIAKHLGEWCPDLMPKRDVQRITSYIDRSNASGYLRYVEKYTIKTGLKSMDNLTMRAEKNTHPNDKYDKDTMDFNASSDVFTLVQKYQCHGIETENFAKNAKRYMKSSAPYNLTSQPFWNACMQSKSGSMKVSKNQFCGCFLSTARGGRASHQGFKNIFGIQSERFFDHSSANDLLLNFWPTAQNAMKQSKTLKTCTLRAQMSGSF